MTYKHKCMKCSLYTFIRTIFSNIKYIILKFPLHLIYSLANFCMIIMFIQTDYHLVFINTTNYISLLYMLFLFNLNIPSLSYIIYDLCKVCDIIISITCLPFIPCLFLTTVCILNLYLLCICLLNWLMHYIRYIYWH